MPRGSDEITDIDGVAAPSRPTAEGTAGDTFADGGPIGILDTEPVELITATMERIGPAELEERPLVRPTVAVQVANPPPASLEPASATAGLLETGTMRLPPPPSVEMAALATLPSMEIPLDGSAGSSVGPNDLARGTILGDYAIESKIGRGGMGDVYLGVHRVIKKRAAIKLLRAEYCSDQGTVQRFTAEARVVNEIGHPNIVDIFAFGQTDDGRQYLVMEYLQGESLRARIAHRGALTPEQLCAIARPLVRALRAAHAKGVIHRDLKPDNIFLLRSEVPGEPEVVKLLDFGLAKLTKPEPGIEDTAKGVLVGTPLYISPEQARGKPVDRKADVYTLGVVMFEMITGRPPFVAAKTIELITKHLTEPAPQPSMYAQGVPSELDDIIVRMMAKDATQRPELVQVLDVLDALADLGKAPTDEMQFTKHSTDDSKASTDELQFPRESAGSIAITAKKVPADELAAQSSSGRRAFTAVKDRGERRWAVWIIAGLIIAGIITTILGLTMT